MNNKIIAAAFFVMSIANAFAQGATPSPTVIPGEIQVNTWTDGDQCCPVTAIIDDGYVVVWDSAGQDESGAGIYAQRFDATGNKVRDEFRANTYTIGDQVGSIVFSIDNGFVVLWNSMGQDGDGYGVYGQIYDCAGNNAGNEFRVNTYTTNDQAGARGAAIENGFVVIWVSVGQDGYGYGIYGQIFDANGNKSGAEFQVNTHTDYDQLGSVVSATGDGFIVVWHSKMQDGSGFGIYGQLFDNSGNTIGSEFQINTYTSDDQFFPSVLTTETGSVVVWESYGPDGSGFGIVGQRFDDNWNKTGNEFLINTHTTATQTFPSIAAAGNGFIVAWDSYEQDGSLYGIYAQLFDGAGSRMGSEFRVNEYTDNSQLRPWIVTTDENAIVVWESNAQDGSGDGIFLRQIPLKDISLTLTDDTGASVPEGEWTDAGYVTVSAAQADPIPPWTAGLDAGSFRYRIDAGVWENGAEAVVAEEGAHEVAFRAEYLEGGSCIEESAAVLIDRGGLTPEPTPEPTPVPTGIPTPSPTSVPAFDPTPAPEETPAPSPEPTVIPGEIQVNTWTGGNQVDPAIAVTETGYIVVWESYGKDGSDFGISGRMYDSIGNALGDEFLVNTYTADAQKNPSIAVTATGFVVVWDSYGQDGSGAGVYGQRFDSDGNKAGSEFHVSTFTRGYQDGAVVAATANGFAVVWQSSEQDGSGAGIYGQCFDHNGNKAGSEFMVPESAYMHQYYPSIVSADGGFIVVWESHESEAENAGIFGRRFNSSGNKMGTEFHINTYTTNPQVYAAIAPLGDDFVVVWQSSEQDGSAFGIYGQRIGVNGNKIGGEFQVNTTTEGSQYFSVVASDENGFAVIWVSFGQDGSAAGVFGQLFDNNGNKVGGEFLIPTYVAGDQNKPSVVIKDSVVRAVWQSCCQDGDGDGIFLRQLPLNVLSLTITDNLDNPVAEDTWSNGSFVTVAASPVDPLPPWTAGLDPASFQYSVDGLSWQNGTAVDIMNEGTFDVRFRAEYIEGGYCLEESVTVMIDNQAPYVTAEGTSGWLDDPAFTLVPQGDDGTGSGIAGWYYQRSDTAGGWTASADVPVLYGFPDGITKVWIYAVDGAGNASGVVETDVMIDTAGPDILFPAAWTGAVLVGSALDEGTGVDETTWSFSRDGAAFEQGNLVTFESEGTYHLWMRVSDYMGHETTEEAGLTVDLLEPIVSIAVETANALTTVTASAQDAGSGVDSSTWQYSLDGGGLLPGNSVSFPAGELHLVYFQVQDAAGNIGFISEEIRTDGTPPVLTASGCGWTNAVPAYAAASAVDEGTGSSGVDPDSWYYSIGSPDTWVKIDGITDPEYMVQIPVTGEGETVVFIRVADAAGNTAVTSVFVRIDTQAPVFTRFEYRDDGGTELPESGGGNTWTNAAHIGMEPFVSDANGGLATSGVERLRWSLDDGLPFDEWEAVLPAVVSEEGETPVYFMAEDAAGNTTQAMRCARLDRTGPGVSAGEFESGYADTVLTFTVMPSATDPLSGVNAGSFTYCFDTGAGDWLPLVAGIDVSGLSEGEQRLYLRAEDNCGNAGVFASGMEFFIDRTPPVLDGIAIISDGNIIEENDYSFTESVQAVPSASDDTGVISGYRWTSLDTASAAPDLAGYTDAATDIMISGLETGVHYLYMAAVDGAGNESPVFCRVIRTDTEVPAAPAVESPTHPYALVPEDAVALTDAVFTVKPGSTGPSGISEYRWELKAGMTEGTAAVLSAGSDPDGRFEIGSLADNGTGEFYFLAATTVSGTGRLSPVSVYVFRVDTTPPSNLTVLSPTHPNPSLYYGNSSGQFGWNRPVDFTGIKTYHYTASLLPVLPEPLPQGWIHEGEWTLTDRRSVSIDLAAAAGAEAGEVYVAVCAEDFSGNRQYDEVSVRFDTGKPWIDGVIAVTPDMAARTADATWPAVQDNIGLDLIAVKLATIDADYTFNDFTNWIPKQEAETSHLFEGLPDDPDITFAFFLKAVDRAGNEMLSVSGFKLNGETVSIDIGRPFTENIEGYIVEGTYSSIPEQCEAYIVLPQALPVTAGGVARDEIELEALVFDAEESFVSGSNEAITYTAAIAGYTFDGEGISISKEEGLVFGTLYLTVQTDSETEKTFRFDNVGVSSPPDILFEETSGAPEAEAFSFQSLRAPEEGETEREPSWIYSGITATGLEGSDWLLADGFLDLSGMHETVNAYILEEDQTRTYLLPAGGVSITPDVETGEGELAGGFYLEAADNLFLVEQAVVRGEKLLVIRAQLILPEGYTEDDVIVENFSIDIDGEVAEEAGFNAAPFTFTVDGVPLTATEMRLIDGRLVITGGTIHYNDGSVDFTGLVITKDGITEGTIPAFSGYFHGFLVESDVGRITADGIVFDTADVYMPEAFGGGTQAIEGLTVTVGDKSIVAPGTGTCDVALQTAYGEGVRALGLSMSSEGFFASEVMVTLPEFLNPGVPVLILENLQLISDGTIGTSDEAESLDFHLPQDEPRFELFGFQLSLTPGGLVFGYADAALTDAYFPDVISFEGLTVTRTAIVTPGAVDDTVGLSSDGWYFDLAGLILDGTGVHGPGEVRLPYEFGYRTIGFPDMRIFPDGSFATGETADEVYLRIHGWMVRAAGISIDGPAITIGEAAVMLYSVMGWGELPVPNVVIGPDGTLISSGEGTEDVSFLSVNGFKVETGGYRFTEDGFFLSGDVYFPPALGETTHASFGETVVQLHSDGCIVTPAVEGPVTYTFGVWPVEAEDFYFDRDGLYIGMNTFMVQAFNLEFLIPEVRYYPDGSIKVAGHSFEGFSFNPFDGPVEIGVTEIGLSDDGPYVSAFIGLPPGFGADAAIYFDRLTLHADGSVTSDVVVREFNFDALGCGFRFRNITFDERGFGIGEAVITLPEALDAKSIRITDLLITRDGDFILGGLGVDPFELWGYIFYLDNLGFADNTITLEGGIRLPYDFFIDELAGVRIDIDEFSYNFDAEPDENPVTFQVSCGETFSFTIMDNYTVNVTGVTVTQDGLGVTQATLDLPEELGIGSVGVTGLFINVREQSVSYEGITITGISFDLAGCTFTVDTLTISETDGFVFEGSVKLPENLPGGMSLPDLVVSRFQLRPDGTIGDIVAGIDGIDTTLLDGLFEVTDGTVTLGKTGDEIVIGCEGMVVTGTRFPEGLSGYGVDLNAFELVIGDGGVELTKFDASSTPIGFTMFGLDFVNAVVRVAKDPETGVIEITLGGESGENPLGIVLSGSYFPDWLRDETIEISTFRFTSDFDIEAFEASLPISGTEELFADIWLFGTGEIPSLVTVKWNDEQDLFEFSLSGNLRLGTSYPEGLAGTEVGIDEISFDSEWNLLALDIDVDLPDNLRLFDAFTVPDGHILISKYSDEDLLIGVRGQILLPDSLPEGLANLPVTITKLDFTSGGEIVDVDISTAAINTTIYGRLSLKNGSLSVTNIGNDELVFSFGGTLNLPPSVGAKFSGMDYNLAATYSTKEGLTDFRAGLDSPVDVELFTGTTMGFDRIDISMDGFTLAGSISFHSPMPQELHTTIVTLEEFTMEWDGTVVALRAGLAHTSFKIAGFTADITNLLFSPDGITLASCVITLPPFLNGYVIGVENAGYDKDGNFYGEVTIPVIELKIAGFTLEVHDPDLSFDPAGLSFSQVMISGPGFLGNFKLKLNGVKITSEGIELTGGAFRLPDFTIAGGLGFSDVFIDFAFSDGTYAFEGGGKIMIPGAGTFDVGVKFVNISKKYPWGIEYATFKYTVYGIGIPIGTTGVYLNQIRGSLVFGPPKEVPSDLRHMFDDGTRISMGVTLVDATGGGVFKGKVDLWIDITDWDWAFVGDVSVLSGMVKARLAAALTKKGFYGDLRVSIAFVKGRVYIYIFKHPKTKKTVVSGGGSIQFGLRKGCIYKKTIKIFWHKIKIRIPPWDIWLPGLHAEFGLFTKSGKEISGFKGWANVPVFGKVGVFVPSSGGIKIGSVSSYKLYTPETKSAVRGSTRGGSLLLKEPAGAPGVYTRDTAVRTGVTDTWCFKVEGKEDGKDAVIKTQSLSTRSAGDDDDDEGEDEEESEDELERLIFYLMYMEGEPEIKVISPSGAVYMPGDPNVMIEYTEEGKALVVLEPEPGEWKVEVSNVINSDAYALEVLGKAVVPEVNVETPAYSGEQTGPVFTVNGTATLSFEEPVGIDVYLARDKEYFVGEKVAETVTDAGGNFSVGIDTTGLADGEYHIFAEIPETEDDPAVRSYAEGSIVVRNSAPLAAVENLTAADNGERCIEVAFDDPNGDRTAGFSILVENLTKEEEKTINIGYLTSITLAGYDDGDTVRLRVVPYDATNAPGEASPAVEVTMGEAKQLLNVMTIPDNTVHLTIPINTVHGGTISYETPSYAVTGTAYDWMDATVIEAPEGMSIGLEGEMWPVACGEGALAYTIMAGESMAPGTYQAAVRFENRGNREIAVTVDFTITLAWPPVECNNVEPDEWNTLDNQVIQVFGDHFYDGTRLFIDDEELAIEEMDKNRIMATVAAGIAEGTHTITVRGPGGDEAQQDVNVEAPRYEIDVLKSTAAVTAGDTEEFPFIIHGENRFDGLASIQTSSAPAGWPVSVSPQAVGAEETAMVIVTVPTGAGVGSNYVDMVSDQGNTFRLTVNVTATYPAPSISSVAPFAGFIGEEITIYGYGFGDAGEVSIDGTPMTTTSYSRGVITAIVPEGSVTGQITVSRDGLSSNQHIFYVKDRGFNLYTDNDTVTIQPGEQATVRVFVNGYDDYVNLEAETGTGDLVTAIEPATVVPNGTADISVYAEAGAAFDSHTLTIRGTGTEATRTVNVTVVVGQAFGIVTETLPAGMEETTYRARIATENGGEPVVFDLDEESELPPGLSLSASGVISGKPPEAGSWVFGVTAEDIAGRKAEKTFSITIEENAWSQTDKGAGRSRYNGVASPADERTLWRSEAAGGAREILTGRRRVFVLSDYGVTGLEQSTGTVVYVYPGDFTCWAYANETIFLLDEGKTFHAVDSLYGNLKWSRPEVEAFTTDGTTLCLGGNGVISVVDTEDGTFGGTIDAELPADTTYLWQNGTLLRVGGAGLRALTAEGWQTVYEDASAQAITDAVCDEEETAVLTETGRLAILGAGFTLLRETETGCGFGRIAFGSERVIVSGDLFTSVYDRFTLEPLFEGSEGSAVIAAAEEKYFTADACALNAVNGYDGEVIWTAASPHTDLAISGECLYALDEDGVVSCYNAPDNLNPPETTIVTVPAGPGGSMGYYTTPVTLALEADDPESYAAETLYRMGAGEETAYTGPIELPEGQYSFVCHSTDNHGYREPDRIATLKVDYTKPVTTLTASGTPGDGIWYLTPAAISIAAADNASGVERIEYSLDDGEWTRYESPLVFAEEATHVLSYRARDYAGNVEDARTIEFGIDLGAPTIVHRACTEPGITAVHLFANDTGSGIKQVNYYVDGEYHEGYTAPIVITEPGSHQLTYIAYDNAGRTSGIQLAAIEVEEFTTGEWTEGLDFAYWLPGRDYIRNIQAGDCVYAPCVGRWNEIDALPDYLEGADYILTHVADKFYAGDAFLTFTAQADIDVYIMKHELSEADLSAWILVEEGFPVEPTLYFRNGADIYRKSYRKGETVTVPGSDSFTGWGNLIFVQYAQSNYIKIISPIQGDDLSPLDTIQYYAVTLGLAYDVMSWEYRLGGGPWQTLGSGQTGTMDVPYVEETTVLQLKVNLTDGDGAEITSAVADYTIVNSFDIELLNPLPGTEVPPGEEVTLIYAAQDAYGRPIPAENVTWSSSTDGSAWSPVPDAQFTAPEEAGTVYLKGEAEAVPGIAQSRQFEITVAGAAALEKGGPEGKPPVELAAARIKRPPGDTGPPDETTACVEEANGKGGSAI
ncbi:MAG: hypothetical protein JW881_21165 [Spirochaetales bacterium]|nr:hypothetical protein [Spirochaetales bacterium]